MLLKNRSVTGLLRYIKDTKKSVVLFGAGVIGNTVVPELFRTWGLLDRVLFYVDNDPAKHGKTVQVCTEERVISGADALKRIDVKETVLLITNSQYGAVVEQLDAMEELAEAEAYIVPVMLVSHPEYQESVDVVKELDAPLIPKVLHYIWLGKNKMPDALEACIATWKEFCPEYEIVRWDESNYDVTKHPYMKQAYDAGKWAYVSDFARLDILYEHGGIYMDTDVYLIKSLDELLYQRAFCSVEKWNVINSGGCCGTVKQGDAIGAMLEFRKGFQFGTPESGYNLTASGFYETQAMLRNGYRLDGSFQKVLDMHIYPSEYFHPYDYMSGQLRKTEHTFSVHCFNGGWLEGNMTDQRKKTQEAYEAVLKRMEQTKR